MGEKIFENLIIRPKNETDQISIQEIVNMSFSYYLQRFAHRGLNSDGEILVGQINQKTVGYVKLRIFNINNETYGAILWLAVHPEYRKNGIASRLLASGTKHLKDRNAKMVFATADPKNKATLTCFKHEQYKKIIFPGVWQLFKWRSLKGYFQNWLMSRKVVVIHMP